MTKRVYLTFDDGPDKNPDPEHNSTHQILKALKQRNWQATFFVSATQILNQDGITVNRVAADLLRRMQADGHVIAVHHDRLFTEMPQSEIEAKLAQTNRLIEDITGQTPAFIRAPGGALPAHSARALNTLCEQGMPLDHVLWHADSRDWSSKILTSDILNFVATKVEAGKVVLFHDFPVHLKGGYTSQDRYDNSTLVAKLFDDIAAKGLRSVTLAEHDDWRDTIFRHDVAGLLGSRTEQMDALKAALRGNDEAFRDAVKQANYLLSYEAYSDTPDGFCHVGAKPIQAGLSFN